MKKTRHRFGIIAMGLVFSIGAPRAWTKDLQIEIRNHAFIPARVTVQAGTIVTWTNEDEDPHTVMEKDGAFRSGALDTQDSFSYVFKKPGTYPYFCTMHPMMVGSIKVAGGKPSKKRTLNPAPKPAL